MIAFGFFSLVYQFVSVCSALIMVSLETLNWQRNEYDFNTLPKVTKARKLFLAMA